jgi:hypothetical protein
MVRSESVGRSRKDPGRMYSILLFGFDKMRLFDAYTLCFTILRMNSLLSD